MKRDWIERGGPQAERLRYHAGMVAALADAALPSPPDAEERLAAAEGIELHVSHFDPVGPARLVLVAMHGFTVYSGPYGHLWQRLAAAGVAVTAFDLRGHGRSGGRRGHVARFELFHEDLALVVAAARKRHARHPALPFALLAHSFGATIALDAVLAGKVTPDRLIVATPFIGRYMKVARWKLALSGVASRLWPSFAPDNEIKPEDGTRNPRVVEGFFKDPLIHHVASARWFTETTAAQQRIVAAEARLAVPTLLLSVGHDLVVATPPIDQLAQAAAAFIQRKHYPELRHELFLEPEWEEVAADIARFLTSSLPEAAASDVPAILQSPP